MPVDSGPIDLQHIGAGLPIGEYRADLEAGLADGAMVVQAPPGTGKTTFVPPLVAALPATDAAVMPVRTVPIRTMGVPVG